MKNKYYYIISSVIVLVLLFLYYNFGGFKTVKITRVENDQPWSLRIWGKQFQGTVQDPDWKKLFIQTRDFIVQGKFSGPVIVVYFKRPETTGNPGKVEAFIGARLSNDSLPPMDFRELKLEKKGVVRADLDMHPVVMPSADKVNRMIRHFADTCHLTLDSLMIEKYYRNNALAVEVPVL